MSIEATYTGYIETTQDTLLIFEACRRGLLPRICRRLQEKERKIVSSGSVFVFDERESGIKRWTDGLVWSPSRILGNFLVYRELDKRSSSGKKDTLSVERQRSNGNDMESQAEKNKERALVGSLTNSYRFKKDGLIKKTMSITVNGVAQHMISYYTKEDVLRGSLKTPSQTPQLATLEISQEFLLRQNFRIPPVIEGYGEGAEPTSPNSVISHSSISTSSSPVMSMTNGCTCSHHPAGSVSPQQQQQPSRMIDYNASNRIKMEMENPDTVYRPPSFASSYTATPSSGFASGYTYPPANNTIADITNHTLPLPSTTNVRGFVTPHSHRQSFSNEFPPVTTASAHMTNPSSRILTSSPPPLMPGHHLSNPAAVTATAAPDYSQYYSSHVSNTTSPTTTATASTWNDYQGFSYPSSTHSNSNGSSNQQSQSHQSHHGGHNESSNDVFYASTTGNPNSDTTTMYGGGGGAGNSYNDLPPSTLPELYNSSSSQSHHHHHHHQTGGPHSSSSPSPTMQPSSPVLNHHHHHHHHSSSNGSTSSSGSSSSNIAPITPPLSSATTNNTTIINGTPISGVFASPTATLNYSSQFTAAATAAYVKGETGYATAGPHSAAAAAAASLAGSNSGMYADPYLQSWMV